MAISKKMGLEFKLTRQEEKYRHVDQDRLRDEGIDLRDPLVEKRM